MRLKKVKNAEIIIKNSKYIVKEPHAYKGKFNELFSNKNKIEIEIGMGKGDFIINKAINNPNINYIGIEMFDSVIVRAVTKLEQLNLNNLLLIKIDANLINEIFSKEISTIYLNFSDPWPKNRHANRRLTSIKFLEMYDDIFMEEKTIIQKTDNADLFTSSLISYNNYGYKIIELTFDLHNSEYNKNNIYTEYETKFSSMGMNIYYIKVVKD